MLFWLNIWEIYSFQALCLAKLTGAEYSFIFKTQAEEWYQSSHLTLCKNVNYFQNLKLFFIIFIFIVLVVILLPN